MEYRQIPGIDRPVSRLVQGALIATDDQVRFNDLYDAVLAHGINGFDTAHAYGDGAHERMLGQWLNSRGLREQVVIVGKGAHYNQDRARVTPFDISADIHDSLARLQVDCIDIYLLHRDNPNVPVGPLVERLHAHREAGHIGIYGGSNWSHERIREANAFAAAHGLQPFTASSPHFSLVEQSRPPWEGCLSISGAGGQEARDWYQSQKMPVLAWSSLGSGFFSGRFTQDNLNSFEESMDQLCVEVYCYGRNWARLARTAELAEQKGLSAAQIALAYVLNQPLDFYPIVASRSVEEIAENVEASGLKLSAEEITWLEA